MQRSYTFQVKSSESLGAVAGYVATIGDVSRTCACANGFLEVETSRNPELLAARVKDQTIGRIILTQILSTTR